MITKDGFIRVSTPRSLIISGVGLLISALGVIIFPILSINTYYKMWASLSVGLAGIVTLRAARGAMELRAEIADENLSFHLRKTKMIMKNLLRALGVRYLVVVAFIIENVSDYAGNFLKITWSLRISIILFIIIYVVSTIIGHFYQVRFVTRK